jgi:hypothetical protein
MYSSEVDFIGANFPTAPMHKVQGEVETDHLLIYSDIETDYLNDEQSIAENSSKGYKQY